MRKKKGIIEQLSEQAPQYLHKQYRHITITEIEKALADMFGRIPSEDDDEVVDFIALHRTDEQVEALIVKEGSGYQKILNGYWYTIDGAGTIHTGAGGARTMYKMFMREGLSEEMAGSLIYVTTKEGVFPLNTLTVIKNQNNAGEI